MKSILLSLFLVSFFLILISISGFSYTDPEEETGIILFYDDIEQFLDEPDFDNQNPEDEETLEDSDEMMGFYDDFDEFYSDPNIYLYPFILKKPLESDKPFKTNQFHGGFHGR